MSILRRPESKELPVTPRLANKLERNRPKRYLVIGSDGHGRRVDSYLWDKLPADINVADFDVVVLNFAAFEENQELAEGFPTDRLPAVDAMARLLFSEHSEIIAIGDPSTLIGPPPEPGNRVSVLFDPRRRADYWLPFLLAVERNEGRSYDVIEKDWDAYFDSLSQYRWIATANAKAKHPDPSSYLSAITQDANGISSRITPIAQTRFGMAIALTIQVGATRSYRYNPTGGPATSFGVAEDSEMVLESSPVFWLPAPDRTTTAEVIGQILRERYGVAELARQPKWAEDYSLPDQAPIEAEMAKLDNDRRDLEDRTVEVQQRADAAAEPIAILYEKGERLETLVRAALRELGAEVAEAERGGVEDGRVRRPEGRAAVEIKGRKDQIKQSDVRQVVQWATDAQLAEGSSHKALIVGNPFCETPPPERGEPLAPNAKQFAENGEVALLTTVQLFEALCQKQAGAFDEGAFWKAVFAARGAVRWPNPG